MKRGASGPKGQMADGASSSSSSETREMKSKLQEEAASSSSSSFSVTEEQQGFTSASQIYSVRHCNTKGMGALEGTAIGNSLMSRHK